jgi:hypothetical protein
VGPAEIALSVGPVCQWLLVNRSNCHA